MSNLDLRIAEIMHGDAEVLKIMKGDVKKWPLSTYTVTTNLTNITSDAPSTILENSPLVVNLSVNSGHYMDDSSVVVMMGNTDISSTYSNGVITIQNVTGNIAITARTMFDAQVEYLQSDGVAYIDTGVLATKFTIDMYVNAVAEQYYALFGSRTAASTNAIYVGIIPDVKWKWYFGTKTNSFTTPTNSARHVFSNNIDGARKLYIDNKIASASTSQTFSVYVNFYLFCCNNGGAALNISPFPLYSAKLWISGDRLGRNYIPVRKDGVGYLFDTVSLQLFGNANSTGSFTYGNDV